MIAVPVDVVAAAHRPLDELERGLPEVMAAPADLGRIEMIVARPSVEARTVLDEGQLTPEDGLVGDGWRERMGDAATVGANTQLTLINRRWLELIAGDRELWPLAGDQLVVDLDLSKDNLPPGTVLQAGTATLEVTAKPHTGCKKFLARFGLDAMKVMSTDEGYRLRLRGMYAKVVDPGTVRPGDAITTRR